MAGVDIGRIVNGDRRAETGDPGPIIDFGGPDSGLVRDRLFGLKLVVLAGDFVVMALAFVLVSMVRYGESWMARWSSDLPAWRVVVPLGFVGGLVLWRRLGMYKVHPDWGTVQEIRRAVGATVYLAVAVLALLFMFDLDGVSRLLLLAWFEAVVLGAVAIRLRARAWFRHRRAEGKGTVNTLVLGGGPLATRYLKELRAHPEAGVQPVGVLTSRHDDLEDVPHLGTLADLEDVLKSTVIDEVVVCLPFERWKDINALAAIANTQGKTVRIPVDMFRGVSAQQRLDSIGGSPVLSLIAVPDSPASAATKRLVDLAGASLALLLAAPFMAVVALLVKLQDRGPIVFSQVRVGQNGRTFRLHKFRSMVVDAEAKKAELEHLNERQGPTFKLSDDPRVTRVGRFIRRTSLDELPQLFNVLRGEMSLVGPRPPLPTEVNTYDPWHRRRLSMKPGITGLWQISARDQPGFDTWVELDLEYIDNWSPMGDLAILARTIPAVLKLSGK